MIERTSPTRRLAYVFLGSACLSLLACAYLLSPRYEEGVWLARGVTLTRETNGIHLAIDYNIKMAVGSALPVMGGTVEATDTRSCGVASGWWAVGSALRNGKMEWFAIDTRTLGEDARIQWFDTENRLREFLRLNGTDVSIALSDPERLFRSARWEDRRLWKLGLATVGMLLLSGLLFMRTKQQRF